MVNPARIQWCCDQIGISLEELAQHGELPQKEALRLGRITPAQLDTVADYFGYCPLFFLEKEPLADQDLLSEAYLALADMHPGKPSLELSKMIRQVEQHRDFYLWLLEDLGLQRKMVALPDIATREDWQAKSAAVRKWLGGELASKATHPHTFQAYRQAIEKQGIMVFESTAHESQWHLPDPKVAGFCIAHGLMPVIFVNAASERQKILTLLHQLAHLLLHRECHIDSPEQLRVNSGNSKDAEANRLAAACLQSFTLTIGSAKTGECKPDVLQPQTSTFKPIAVFGNDYVRTVLDAAEARLITLHKATQYLGDISLHEYRQLEMRL